MKQTSRWFWLVVCVALGVLIPAVWTSVSAKPLVAEPLSPPSELSPLETLPEVESVVSGVIYAAYHEGGDTRLARVRVDGKVESMETPCSMLREITVWGEDLVAICVGDDAYLYADGDWSALPERSGFSFEQYLLRDNEGTLWWITDDAIRNWDADLSIWVDTDNSWLIDEDLEIENAALLGDNGHLLVLVKPSLAIVSRTVFDFDPSSAIRTELGRVGGVQDAVQVPDVGLVISAQTGVVIVEPASTLRQVDLVAEDELEAVGLGAAAMGGGVLHVTWSRSTMPYIGCSLEDTQKEMGVLRVDLVAAPPSVQMLRVPGAASVSIRDAKYMPAMPDSFAADTRNRSWLAFETELVVVDAEGKVRTVLLDDIGIKGRVVQLIAIAGGPKKLPRK